MNKISFVIIMKCLVISVFFNSCCRNKDIAVSNINSEFELKMIVKQFIEAENNKDTKKLLKMLDYKIFYLLNMSIPLGDDIKVTKVHAKLLINASWSIQEDKALIHKNNVSSNVLDINLIQLLCNNGHYATLIVEDTYFFFKKVKSKWKIYYIGNLEELSEIDSCVNEIQISDLLLEVNDSVPTLFYNKE